MHPMRLERPCATRRGPLLALVIAAAGCGDDPDAAPYASELIRFDPGAEAGYGEEDLPDVVLGAPDGRGTMMGALDVLSLGIGGEIVLGFGDRAIVDGDGPDFLVFENSFWPAGDAEAVFAELGEVAVSPDGERWETFECGESAPGQYPGCAGWNPTLEYDPDTVVPLDPELTGGDPFDLAEVGLERATHVRIRDLASEGSAPSAGFDLDAIGAIHLE
ncbi:MAG: cell surface protein [Myxococcales bacterium]|nr:cell surface protein [Myxococcales bacterium]